MVGTDSGNKYKIIRKSEGDIQIHSFTYIWKILYENFLEEKFFNCHIALVKRYFCFLRSGRLITNIVLS